MYQFFLICATIGGTILILRLGLSLLGLGFDSLDGVGADLDDAGLDADVDVDHADAGHDHQSGLGKVLTFQAIVSFLAFFGVGGLAAIDARLHPGVTVAIALGTGLVAVTVLGYLLRALRRLNTDGTVQIRRAVGTEGTVYLRIPAHEGGEGKIFLPIQGRTIEVIARTPGPELAPGEPIVISRIIDDRVVEVVIPHHLAPKPPAFAGEV